MDKTLEDENVKKVEPKKVKKTKVDELNVKIKELEEKILYKDAELINYRKRKDDEVATMLKYANTDIILEILTVVDDLERAIGATSSDSGDVSKFLSGVKMIYSRILNILNSFEVKEIEALNKEFDPTYHQGVLTSKVDGVEPNIVVEVLQKGYMYKDKVIRPSMVKVSE